MTQHSSRLWDSITKTLFSQINDSFLENFRAPGGPNARLAAWDPQDRSLRYFKFLLFHIARTQSDKSLEMYRSLQNTLLGNPVTVSVAGCQIDIDYLLAIEEWDFLNDYLQPPDIKVVVEIGAGFGRTCHTLMCSDMPIENYYIVDLAAVLKLSKAYLSKVIPELIDKIHFVDSRDHVTWSNIDSDLVVNIDSFQEMPSSVINGYLQALVPRSRYFYCKNPIGKYLPSSVGLTDVDPEKLLDVFSLGYCQDIIDIFDEDQLESARRVYLDAYIPKDGQWKVLGERPMRIFPYYHHALFIREQDE